MLTALIVAIIYFIFVVFIYGQSSPDFNNLFLSYYIFQLRFFITNLLLLTTGFFGLFFLYTANRKKRKPSLLKKLISISKKFIIVLLVGSFLAFIILLLISVVELNTLSLLTYISPKLTGVETNGSVIEDKLRKGNAAPYIIVTGNRNFVPYVAEAQSGKDGMYGGLIISSIPSFLIIPPKQIADGILMTGDTIIVTQINSTGFKKTSPILSYLMIKKYFSGREVRSYPQVSLMDKNEYLTYRREDFDKKMEKFDDVIKKIGDEINTLSDTIGQDNKLVSDNQNEQDRLSLQKEKEYTKCINTGYYKSGTYIRTNTKEYCQEKRQPLEEQFVRLKKEGEDLKNNLNKDQNRLEEYRSLSKYYSRSKVLTKTESGYISFEFGTFNPPDQIRISLVPPDSEVSAADYFEILIHEYLHYATYGSGGKKLTSAFFEEGLTEYFARKIIEDNLGRQTNMGYPVNVKIIDRLAGRISDSDLSDIYFANDQTGLEKLLDKVYGKNFYRDNIVSLEILQYLSDKDEILKHANEVMAKIGGEPLGEKDIYTSGTDLN